MSAGPPLLTEGFFVGGGEEMLEQVGDPTAFARKVDLGAFQGTQPDCIAQTRL